jgi:hypothetical protein
MNYRSEYDDQDVDFVNITVMQLSMVTVFYMKSKMIDPPTGIHSLVIHARTDLVILE